MDKILTVIPFSGFYESAHDAAMQEEFDSIFHDDRGNFRPSFERPYNALLRLMNWRQAEEEYAREYVDSLACYIGEAIGGKMDSREARARILEFESMYSPREYNFGTDRLFAFIPRALLVFMYKETPRAVLAEYVESHFTSRSGFCSFYSNELDSWELDSRLVKGEGKPLDHNEAGAILCSWLASRKYGDSIQGQPKPEKPDQIEKAFSDCREWLDLYLCDDFSGSGLLSNMIWSAIPDRAKKLANAVDSIARGDALEGVEV